MIRCYCCERRWPESADAILGGCECREYTCQDCLLCTEHCACRSADSADSGPTPFVVTLDRTQHPSDGCSVRRGGRQG